MKVRDLGKDEINLKLEPGKEYYVRCAIKPRILFLWMIGEPVIMEVTSLYATDEMSELIRKSRLQKGMKFVSNP
ncbi:MAG: hypothetical protein EAZ89_13510 [Bacteroidetes bacterium]|nr:MAG: hypothetical protein EAZ89_13510 [Bacteroidota bacterium]